VILRNFYRYTNTYLTAIPTWSQSMLVTSEGPMLQLYKYDVNLVIIFKMVKSNILVLIPVINKNKRYVNCFALLSLRTVNTVTHSYGTSAVLLQCLLCKYRLLPFVSKSSKFFSLLIVLRFTLKVMGGKKSTQTFYMKANFP
jgi:hypothetical protein